MGGCFVCGRAGQCGWVFSVWEGGSVGGCLVCGRVGQWVGVLCGGGRVSGWVFCVWEGRSVWVGV